MKKSWAIFSLVFMFLNYALIPFMAFAIGEENFPSTPYEKVISKNGSWYVDRITFEDTSELIVAYTKPYEIQNEGTKEKETFDFNINEAVVLTGVYVPFVSKENEQVTITITDSKGKIYGPFVVQSTKSNSSQQKNTSQNDIDQGIGQAEETEEKREDSNKGIDKEIEEDNEKIEVFIQNEPIDYIFIPNNEIVLNKGEYSFKINNGKFQVRNADTGSYGAFLIKGVNLEANEKYKEELIKWQENRKKNYDYTGTYIIDADAFKTSTLMGMVNEKKSSFSLRDFEIVILDKNDSIEIIGNYEGMPFSQECKIIERNEKNISAQFDFVADLSNLPYKAKIGTSVVFNIAKNKDITINIDGTGTYQREASSEKGADYNTYSVKGKGSMKRRDLPPYVINAVGKQGGVGNIPGPDNSVVLVTGLLFPPLSGVVVHVVQELLKPKPPVIRNKEWYKNKFPGKTDEQIAMIMLADALGNSDEPDDDPESVGDNEKPGGEDYIPPVDYNSDSQSNEYEHSQDEDGAKEGEDQIEDWEESYGELPQSLGGEEENPYTSFEGENPCA